MKGKVTPNPCVDGLASGVTSCRLFCQPLMPIVRRHGHQLLLIGEL
jgi:hypothetical protein